MSLKALSELDKKRWLVRSKVWLELDGKPVIGKGRLNVLKAVDRYGSLVKAAEETGIAYRRVRGAVREMELALGVTLVLTRRGGQEGGGAVLTDVARELLERFDNFAGGVQELMDSRFRQLF